MMGEEDQGYGPSDTNPIHKKILDALEAGYNPQDIIDVYKTSKKPEHQEWYRNYAEKQKERDDDNTVVSPAGPDNRNTSGPGSPMMDWVDTKLHGLSPTELMLGAGGLAITAGTLAGASTQIGKNIISRVLPSAQDINKRESNEVFREQTAKMRNANVTNPAEEEHQAKLRDMELAIKQEKLNQEKAKTAKLSGVSAPSQTTPVSPTQAGTSVELPDTSQVKVETTPTDDALEFVKSTINPPQAGAQPPATAPAPVNPSTASSPQSIGPNVSQDNWANQNNPTPAVQPKSPAEQVVDTVEGKAPAAPVPAQAPTGQPVPNTPESGDNASPLHEPGASAGEKPIDTIKQSSGNPQSEGEPTTETNTTAPKSKSTKTIQLNDTPEQWQKLTKQGVTFLPGYGPGDNNLYNTFGAEGRKALLEKYNNGKPIGSYENYLAFKDKLAKGVPSSDVPELMARFPTEDEAGNFGALGRKGLIKGAGTAGLLVTAAQLSHAAEEAKKGNYAPARETGFNLASALLGRVGPLATYHGSLNEGEEKALAQQRYKYEMSKKNGAGRGQINRE